MVSFYNKPNIDSKRIERFHTAKKEYMPFLSSILWKLTYQRDLFKVAMHHALYGLWQQLDRMSGQQDFDRVLYEIALTANQYAWSQANESHEIEPAGVHHLSRLFSGRQRLPHRVRYAIGQLEFSHALLIVLRYVERKTTSEIAEFVKSDESQVQFGISQALIELKSRLRIHIKCYLELHGLANSELADLELIAV